MEATIKKLEETYGKRFDYSILTESQRALLLNDSLNNKYANGESIINVIKINSKKNPPILQIDDTLILTDDSSHIQPEGPWSYANRKVGEYFKIAPSVKVMNYPIFGPMQEKRKLTLEDGSIVEVRFRSFYNGNEVPNELSGKEYDYFTLKESKNPLENIINSFRK